MRTPSSTPPPRCSTTIRAPPSSWPTSRRRRSPPAARRHPDRVLNVGIREQLMIGVGRRARPDRTAPDRALVRHVPRRPGVRADQAGPGPPGRGRRPGQHRRVLRRVGRGPHPPVARATWRCSTPSDGWTVHVPGHPDEVRALLRGGRDQRRSDLPAALRASATPRRTRTPAGYVVLRAGRAARRCVVAVGPMLDPALAATDRTGRDGRVHPHAPAVRHATGLRALRRQPDVVAGASRTWPAPRARSVSRALAGRTAPAARPRRGPYRPAPVRRSGRPRPVAWPGRGRAAPVDQRLPRLTRETDRCACPGPDRQARGTGGERVRSRPRIQIASTPSFQVIFLPSSRPRAR